MRNDEIVKDIIKLLLFHLLLVAAFMGLTHADNSRKLLLYTYLFITVLVPSWRLFIVYLLKLYRIKGGNFRKVIIVGVGDTSKELQNFFDSQLEYGYRFLGFFDDNSAHEKLVKGTLKDVELFSLENKIDEIYCSIPDLKNTQIQKIIDFGDNNLVRVKLLPESTGFYNKNLKVDFYDHLPVLIMRSIPLDNVLKKKVKRILDIAFSLFIIVFLLSWLLPLLAIIIKLTSSGPVFFKQKRSGINNDYFWCWKLRTMYVNDKAHDIQATKGDVRVTSIGKYLRKFNLDELPQFFNVLIGNMSVVGPRPHMLKHTEEYSQSIDKYMVRHFVKPGITGLSQIKGYRGEITDTSLMRSRVKIDIFYLENWSFILDVKIILLTVYNMFKGEKNAY